MPSRAPDRARPPLTRERALAAAMGLADTEGTDAVTMRRLATELGVVPMALYRHVTSKDDLVAGLVDAVISTYAPVAPGLPWREQVRAHALSAREALEQHPWVRRLIETATVRTPAVLAHLDRVAGAFMSGGISADLTHHAMHVLGHRVWGFSPEAFTPSTSTAEEDPPDVATSGAAAAAFRAQHPHITAIAIAATGGDLGRVGRGCDEDFEFVFALDLLLDAVERLHERGWPSAQP